MASEPRRLCGFRKVGGTYLCGKYIHIPCDRMPFPLTTCPICGQGIKVGRGFTQVNPYWLWGTHQDCQDQLGRCFLCDPQDQPAYIMLVGENFYKTPGDFIKESLAMGISKRIPFVPKGLDLGKTVLYLAHPKACEVREPEIIQQAMAILEQSETKQPRLLVGDKVEKRLGIFTAFIPQRIEKLCWQSQYTEENIERHRKRGIELIPVPDGDRDHQ